MTAAQGRTDSVEQMSDGDRRVDADGKLHGGRPGGRIVVADSSNGSGTGTTRGGGDTTPKNGK